MTSVESYVPESWVKLCNETSGGLCIECGSDQVKPNPTGGMSSKWKCLACGMTFSAPAPRLEQIDTLCEALKAEYAPYGNRSGDVRVPGIRLVKFAELVGNGQRVNHGHPDRI